MIKKRVEELSGGEVLAKPAMTLDYQIILQPDAVLKKEYIGKLEELGVREVWVKKENFGMQEMGILKTEIKESLNEKVKDILERHTYRNNQELEELSKTADNIIVNILGMEEVVERIFDIRERSADIYEHSVSVCSMSILTALKMDLDKKTIHNIGVGCLLHDIGLRYSTINFNKRDVENLNAQEKAEYRKHPVYGYTDLEHEEWISDVSKNIVLGHHERLDGSGFPLRVKDLPVECRIVSVCDAFDEMICGISTKSTKVYEAIEYLKHLCGTQFDAKVVGIFLQFMAVYPSGSIVVTNEGETAVVVSQNKDFQDRPVIRILKDKDGNEVTGEVLKDLVRVHNVFIEKVIE